MLRYLPVILVLGLAVYCFIDVFVTDQRRFRSLGKPLWLLVVLLPVIGAILWLTLGRPHHKAKPASDTIHLRRPPRPVAPDDDPEFLRRLDEQTWRAKRDAERAAQGDAGEEKPDSEGDSSSGQQPNVP